MFTVSKSIDVNLKSLRKKGGSRILLLLWAMVTLEEGLGVAVLLEVVVANLSPTSGECEEAESYRSAKSDSISIIDRLL
jgi:hypothetical protein